MLLFMWKTSARHRSEGVGGLSEHPADTVSDYPLREKDGPVAFRSARPTEPGAH